jgi:hypothetical protein
MCTKSRGMTDDSIPSATSRSGSSQQFFFRVSLLIGIPCSACGACTTAVPIDLDQHRRIVVAANRRRRRRLDADWRLFVMMQFMSDDLAFAGHSCASRRRNDVVLSEAKHGSSKRRRNAKLPRNPSLPAAVTSIFPGGAASGRGGLRTTALMGTRSRTCPGVRMALARKSSFLASAHAESYTSRPAIAFRWIDPRLHVDDEVNRFPLPFPTGSPP